MASKSVSRSVIWQLLGKFLLQGIFFITTPIFTRILTPEDYGYTALYASWLSIMGLIVGLQVSGSIANARIKYGEEKLNSYLSSIMTISLISFAILLIIISLFNKFISNLMGMSWYMVLLVTVQGFFSFVINFEITRLDQLKMPEKSTIFSLCQTILVIILSLIFVLFTNNNKAEAKIFGQALPIIVIGIVLLFFIYYRGKRIWDSEYNKFCLALTLPLIVHGIGHLIFSQSDRIMLQKIQGKEVLGVYSVVLSLCNVLTIIYGALNTAWLPFYYDYKKQDNKEEICIHTKRYVKFFTLLSLGFLLLSTDVYKIMAPMEYYSGMKIVPIFVLSKFFAFIYLFPVNFEFYYQKTKLIPIATFSAAIINIIINWVLIPNYGIIGAAMGTLCAHILLYLFHEIMARKIGKENYEYRKNSVFFIMTFVLTIFCIIFYFYQNIPIYIRWGCAIVIGIYMIFDFIKFKSVF